MKGGRCMTADRTNGWITEKSLLESIGKSL